MKTIKKKVIFFFFIDWKERKKKKKLLTQSRAHSMLTPGVLMTSISRYHQEKKRKKDRTFTIKKFGRGYSICLCSSFQQATFPPPPCNSNKKKKKTDPITVELLERRSQQQQQQKKNHLRTYTELLKGRHDNRNKNTASNAT